MKSIDILQYQDEVTIRAQEDQSEQPPASKLLKSVDNSIVTATVYLLQMILHLLGLLPEKPSGERSPEFIAALKTLVSILEEL